MRKFKKIALLLITVSLLLLASLSLVSCGDTVTEGGIIYSGTSVVGVESDEGALTIKDGTTVITSDAFSGRANISSLKIPDTVHTIEAGAFSGCEALIEVVDGVSYVDSWVVDAGDSLTEITLRPGTVGIAKEALSGLSQLKSLTIPDTVKYINARALYGARALERISLPFIGSAKNSTYSMHFGYIFGAFSAEKNQDYVPSSLKSVTITQATKIFERAFSACKDIENISLPKTLNEIGARAFEGCVALREISIPDSASIIGERSFLNCYSLGSVKFPENEEFKVIDQFAFAYCKSLREINIPDTVDTIRACAFAVCESLESVTFPDKTLELIGQQAFNGCKKLVSLSLSARLIERGTFRQCKRLDTVTIGEGTEELLGFVFEDCTAVKSITLPEGLTYIGESIFKGCSLLEGVNIPEGIELIEEQSFLNCSSLKTLSIPDSVKAIRETAFDGTPAKIETIIDGVTYIDGWITDADASLTTLSLSSGVRGICDNILDDCQNLRQIHFGGTEAEWLALAERTKNSRLSGVTVTFGEG